MTSSIVREFMRIPVANAKMPVSLQGIAWSNANQTPIRFRKKKWLTMREHFSNIHLQEAREQASRDFAPNGELQIHLQEECVRTEVHKKLEREIINRYSLVPIRNVRSVFNPLKEYAHFSRVRILSTETLYKVIGAKDAKFLSYAHIEGPWIAEAGIVRFKQLLRRGHEKNSIETCRGRVRDLTRILDEAMLDTPSDLITESFEDYSRNIDRLVECSMQHLIEHNRTARLRQ